MKKSLFNKLGLKKYTKRQLTVLKYVVNNFCIAKKFSLYDDSDNYEWKGEYHWWDPDNGPKIIGQITDGILHYELYFQVSKHEFCICAEMRPNNGGYELGILTIDKCKNEDFVIPLLNWNSWESKKYEKTIRMKNTKLIMEWLESSLKELS